MTLLVDVSSTFSALGYSSNNVKSVQIWSLYESPAIDTVRSKLTVTNRWFNTFYGGNGMVETFSIIGFSRTKETLNLLQERFHDHIISGGENINWLSKSCDLTLLDIIYGVSWTKAFSLRKN